ncbi:EthD family reductase [Kitasatospora sp. NPDC048722]|uniref:EthD domain-containing protein n=1 Tax=Kitasatospora sp. NPDC048722 TaxID=3155639 RepID=UPI0033F52056
MIHQIILAHPKPGMSEQNFQRYWVEQHAVRYAARIPQIRRYCVDTRVPRPDDPEDPLWSGVAEIWLENQQEQLASLQTPEFLDGARLDEPRWAAFWRTVVLDTDAHVLLDGPAAGAPATKVMILVKRREGLPLADFRERSLARHAPVAQKVPGLRRYVQNHTRDASYGVGEAVLDAAYQLWFDDVDAFEAARRTPEYRSMLADLGLFTEARYVHTLLLRENWILGRVEPR